MIIRAFARILKVLYGFIYDYYRYICHSAWKANFGDTEIRNYHTVKVYHSLEKGMSFRNQRINFGWGNAFRLLDLIKLRSKHKEVGFHDEIAPNVLTEFLNLERNKNSLNAKKTAKELREIDFSYSKGAYGSKTILKSDIEDGILHTPEKFFLSRYSIREFKKVAIDETIIRRAVYLSIKTPTVCNRQPWHVYHTPDPDVIKSALKFQAGNKGFGENIPNLIIVATDLKAFMSGNERYQHWIEGGLFSMSLVYSLHSLGIASCCLNWSVGPTTDKHLRNTLKITKNHTIIMMIVLGYPNDNNKVCISARRPIDEIYTTLKLK